MNDRDIVEQLRWRGSPLYDEAADEIERLRRQIVWVVLEERGMTEGGGEVLIDIFGTREAAEAEADKCQDWEVKEWPIDRRQA